MKPIKNKLILVLILGLGLGLRLYQFGQNPPSLNHNEVAIGYNAYSLVKTARDQQGNFLPLFFNLYNQIRLPGYIYLTTIPTAIFGPTTISVRLMSMLAGVGLIFISYLITKQLTNNETVSLFTAFLTALSPWSLFLSRMALSTSLSAVFISLGIYFWLKNKSFVSFIFWAVSLYFHLTSWLIVPILIVYPLILLIKEKEWKDLILSLSFLILIFLPFGYQFAASAESVKNFSLNIVNPEVNFLSSYLNNVNPKAIFLNRGETFYFSVPGHGLLFLTTVPFILIGLFNLIKKNKWIVVLWLLISFIPASLWFKNINLGFTAMILPLPMILTGFGLSQTLAFLKKKSKIGGKLVLIVLLLAVSIEFGTWWRDYWKIYQKNYSWAWQYGYQQTIVYVKQNYSKYDQIIFTSKHKFPKQHLLFYWPWEPSYYHQIDSEDFDKFKFVNDYQLAKQMQNSQAERKLIITAGDQNIGGGKLVKQIDYLNGEVAFQLIELK
jgi:4-amino-4-deoxy-L-arabinose transferase-like glycosyltransferase